MMDPSSSFGRLEMDICTANWTDISMKMGQTYQSERATAATEDMVLMVRIVRETCVLFCAGFWYVVAFVLW